ncbi:hypothetical protein GGH95_002592, partial [Coemansia sp. RSA 1836]
MLTHVPSAQTLPSNVLHRIIQLTASDTMLDRGSVEPNNAIVKELLSVCSNCDKSNSIVINNLGWDRKFRLPLDAANLVRELNIFAPMAAVVSSAAFKLVSEYMGATTSLPLIHKLLFIITDYKMDQTHAKDSAISNAVEFGQLFSSMTQASAMETVVKFTSSSKKLDEYEECALGAFLNALYDSTQTSTLQLNGLKLNSASTIDTIPQLSSLDLICAKPLDVNMQLVHKCANTLVNLSIVIGDTKSFLYNADGNTVVYSNLQNLQVYPSRTNIPGEQAATPDIVSFPILKAARIAQRYPFSDDVLFRGNVETLEQFEFYFNNDTMDVFNRLGVFDAKRKCLRKVIVNEQFSMRGPEQINKPDLVKFLGNLFGSAQVLKLSSTGF